MRKKNNMVRYSTEQLKDKLARGEDRTNREKADKVTGPKLEASILADPDDDHTEPDWTQAIRGIPPRKDHINIRVDHDVLQWFKANGKGYQTLMNNVLRAFVQAKQSSDTGRHHN